MSLVLDNSVALAWCFGDEQTPEIMAILDEVAEEGAIAPQLWPLEALNALLSAERRGRITSSARHQLSRFLADLPIAIDRETADRVWMTTAVLAERHGLTAYDAAYLELASRSGATLATQDRQLIAAARSLGVAVAPPAP